MDNQDQIIQKINTAASALIVVSGLNGDSLAAGLAMHQFFKKLEKEVLIISYLPKLESFNFLPDFSLIQSRIDATKSFVIDVSTKQNEIEELSYKKEPQQLSIFIKPKKGIFTAADVTFRSSSFPFDLIVLVGIESLDRLGDLYAANAELFFETPMLNIDYKSTNESYAQFNLINLAATSNSEIVFDLISRYESSLIDNAIATELLAGIISETNSFQHVRTTPQTFMKASQLVSLGADQREIIQRLYKTKSLGLLKLWGRVLARLKQNLNLDLVSSIIQASDLEKSQATDADVELIIHEMRSQLQFAKLFLLLKEEEGSKTTVYFHSALPLDLNKIFARFQPQTLGHQTLKFVITEPAAAAETEVLSLLSSQRK